MYFRRFAESLNVSFSKTECQNVSNLNLAAFSECVNFGKAAEEAWSYVASKARHRLLACNSESWQAGFDHQLPDGFFLWTLFKFGAPLVS